MSQKELLENKVLDARGVQVDSSAGVSLVDRFHLGSGLDPFLVAGKRRLIKSIDDNRYYFLVDYGEGYGYFRQKDSYDTKWRRVDIVTASPARRAYSALMDSYDSCLEIQQFFPLLFNLDSIYQVADSTQIGMTDDSLYLNLNMVIERISADPVSMWNEEKAFAPRTVLGLSPKADSSYISYDAYNNLIYNGEVYGVVNDYTSWTVKRETDFLVYEADDDHNVYSNRIDSVQGVNVVFFNSTDNEWQHKLFSQDSIPESWTDGDAVVDENTTSLTDSSQEFEREYYTYNTGLTYHFRDALGIYHYPDFTFFNRVKEIRDGGEEWGGSFDSLGAPWNTWSNKHRGFDFEFPTTRHSLVVGDDFNGVDDSYTPIPLGVIGLRDSA